MSSLDRERMANSAAGVRWTIERQEQQLKRERSRQQKEDVVLAVGTSLGALGIAICYLALRQFSVRWANFALGVVLLSNSATALKMLKEKQG